MKTTNYLMESYLDSSIELEDKQILVHKIKQSKSLAQELAFRDELNHLASEDDIALLRQKLNLAHRLQKEEVYNNPIPQISRKRTRRIFYAAATVTGIALGGWAIISGGNYGVDYGQLYENYFTPYPPVTIFRESNALELQRGFVNAMNLYQASRFTEAAIELEKLLTEDPSSTTIRFYLGVSYMKLGEYSKSRENFDQIINKDPFFTEQAMWYKSLCYIAEKETESAIETLTALNTQNTSYKGKAEKLLKKLKRN
jgi:tetratricopeptide (TPR) repeat protein